MKQFMYAFLPVISTSVSFVWWYVYGVREKMPFFAKRTDKWMKTPKDKFIVTVTAVIFLIYPTICNQAFSLFSCKLIGQEQYLFVDLQEPCYRGRHLSMVFGLGVTQLLLYVFGLPALVMWFLWHNTHILPFENSPSNCADKEANNRKLFSNPVAITRWGLFFKR